MKTLLPTIIVGVTSAITIPLVFTGNLLVGFAILLLGVGAAIVLKSGDKKQILPVGIIVVGGTLSVLLFEQTNMLIGTVATIVTLGAFIASLPTQNSLKEKTKA